MNVVQSYDARGRLDSEIKVFDDGHYSRIDYDQANEAAWSLYARSYDASDRLIEDLLISDTGAATYVYFDAAMRSSWSVQSYRYDPVGTLQFVYNQNENGSTSSFEKDTQNVYAWTHVYTSIQVNGMYGLLNGDDRTVQFDDGSFVVSSSRSYSNVTVSITSYYDVNGQYDLYRNYTSWVDSSPTLTITDYDNKNEFSWYSATSVTSSDGLTLLATAIRFDDGTNTIMRLKSEGVEYETADAFGRQTQYAFERTDGSSTRTEYDVGNTAPWREVTVTHDAQDRQTSYHAVFDNGTQDWSYYDVDGRYEWSAASSHSDDASRAVTWTALLDNGTVISGFDLV